MFKDAYDARLREERARAQSARRKPARSENLEYARLEFAAGKNPRVLAANRKCSRPKLKLKEEEKEKEKKKKKASAAYLNDYPKVYKPVDPNPATIVTCALKDLLALLSTQQAKGKAMFQAVGKHKLFEVIEKHAAILRVSYCRPQGVGKETASSGQTSALGRGELLAPEFERAAGLLHQPPELPVPVRPLQARLGEEGRAQEHGRGCEIPDYGPDPDREDDGLHGTGNRAPGPPRRAEGC